MTFVNDYLTNDMINSIGHITAEWALMEAELSVAIWDYCEMDRKQGLCITADLGAMAKINMFSALAKRHFVADSKMLEVIEDLTKRLGALNTERNTVVHQLWAVDRAGMSISASKTSTKSRKLTDVKVQKTDAELVTLVQQIDVLYDDLRTFQLSSGVRPPSRTKLP
jgi:hypothetical protein